MAKFCSNCGAPLGNNQKFCTECGSPVMAQVNQQQPQNAYQQLQAYQQQQPYHQQMLQNTVNRPVRKKKSKAWLVILIIVLVLLLGAAGFFGFRDGGWFRKKSASYTPAAMESLRAYAEQLEASGNTAAAEAVYEQLARGGGAELIDEAHDDIPIIAAADEAAQLEEFANTVKGGGR